MPMLIQHFKISRSHSCHTETRTWTLIDCIMASLALMCSAHFFPWCWSRNTTVIKMQIWVTQTEVGSFNPPCTRATKCHEHLQHSRKTFLLQIQYLLFSEQCEIKKRNFSSLWIFAPELWLFTQHPQMSQISRKNYKRTGFVFTKQWESISDAFTCSLQHWRK